MNDAVTTALCQFLQSLPARAERLWVAYSGGLDSSVLLHALVELSSQTVESLRPELLAVHVDHGLHQDSAGWARHCQQVADRLGVPIRLLQVEVDGITLLGPEGAARKARYAAMQSHLHEGDWLLTAHHAEDQAETFLLRALRGAGPAGLTAMRPARALGAATLARPLLGVARAEILAYARRHALRWIEDPSNADPRMDRNFLRGQVLPLLAGRWPRVSQAFAHSARNLRAADFFATAELHRRLQIACPSAGQGFALAALAELPPFARPALLLHWLANTGLPPPPPKALAEILHQLDHAGAGRSLEVRWGNTEVRRYRDSLYALSTAKPAVPVDCPWNTAQPLRLYDDRCLRITGGAPPQVFHVRSSAGRDRMRIADQRPQRQPRQLFQEHGIPPWQRQRALYLFDNPDQPILAPAGSDNGGNPPSAPSGPNQPRLLAVLPWFLHPDLRRWLQVHDADIQLESAPIAKDA
ncbi:MAG: tRNA lysidine(34) synthetase TilS [Lysobacterales bacterium]